MQGRPIHLISCCDNLCDLDLCVLSEAERSRLQANLKISAKKSKSQIFVSVFSLLRSSKTLLH